MSRPTGNALELVKIRRGNELFWCIVRQRHPDGAMTLEVNNHTVLSGSPRFGTVVEVSDAEEIIDRMVAQPALRLVS